MLVTDQAFTTWRRRGLRIRLHFVDLYVNQCMIKFKLCNCNILKACWLVFLCDQLLALEWSLQLIVAFAAYVSPLRRIFSDHCNIKRKWRLLFLSTCEWYLVILLTALWNSIWYWPTSKVINLTFPCNTLFWILYWLYPPPVVLLKEHICTPASFSWNKRRYPLLLLLMKENIPIPWALTLKWAI